MRTRPDRRAPRPLGALLSRGREARSGGGADRSGLASLLDLCALNAAGDALVAVALANTIFFVNANAARSRVLLYLVITMVPFALLAPLIGPLLDRMARGRRIALAATMLARAGLCLALAAHHDALTLFPAALGVLVTSRAFGIAKSAVVPRVLPPGGSLVRANSRLSLAGVFAAALLAPLGAGLIKLTGDYSWSLRLGALVFAAAVLVAFTLPPHVDSAAGEHETRGLTREALGQTGGPRGLGGLPRALRTVLGQRTLVGFLTFFLAFELRHHGTLGLGLLAGAAGLGSALGVALGGRLSRRRPELLMLAGLVAATAACLVAAIVPLLPVELALALLATTAASMSKLSLDAVVQRDVEERSRTSAFGRSETTLQLGWVVGGALGLVPVAPRAGLIGATVVMAAALGVVLYLDRRDEQPRPVPAAAPAPAPPPPSPPPPAAAGAEGRDPAGPRPFWLG